MGRDQVFDDSGQPLPQPPPRPVRPVPPRRPPVSPQPPPVSPPVPPGVEPGGEPPMYRMTVSRRVAHPWVVWVFLAFAVQVVLLIAVVRYIEYRVDRPHVPPVPGPTLDVREAGKAYGIDQLRNYARLSRKTGTDIQGGKSMGDASKSFHDALLAANREDYVKRFGSVITSIVTEGGEPDSAEKRAKLAQFYNQLADGVETIPGVK